MGACGRCLNQDLREGEGERGTNSGQPAMRILKIGFLTIRLTSGKLAARGVDRVSYTLTARECTMESSYSEVDSALVNAAIDKGLAFVLPSDANQKKQRGAGRPQGSRLNAQ